jgi:hypothetical protein
MPEESTCGMTSCFCIRNYSTSSLAAFLLYTKVFVLVACRVILVPGCLNYLVRCSLCAKQARTSHNLEVRQIDIFRLPDFLTSCLAHFFPVFIFALNLQWAGKTIALGTFPSSEADEKCARAKALTRAWRSTMRPKPSRDWVMLELERLGVRVVSGRLGRKAGEEGEDDASQGGGSGKKPSMTGQGGGGGGGPSMERNNSMGWGGDADLSSLIGRRNSSLGLSMMTDNQGGRRGSLSSLGPVVGLDGDPTMPPHRPLVGGGAAAAYEAARHDHFTQKSAEQQRRASSLGLGSLAGGGLSQIGMSVNPNQ